MSYFTNIYELTYNNNHNDVINYIVHAAVVRFGFGRPVGGSTAGVALVGGQNEVAGGCRRNPD